MNAWIDSAPLSPTVSKVSSGAVEMMKIVKVSNLRRFLEELRNSGKWNIVGTGELPSSSSNISPFDKFRKNRTIVVLGDIINRFIYLLYLR